ncbi:NADH(P)-binding protein, PF13460 family [Leptospira santarosai str. CBC379]|uniref:NADH(P)-binding protein, PF13460 family n=1 Tax=Leptospira santarosai str. MOR084 TaxID=1049984 RepID=A0A0E2BKB1_9LEPT|nr:oxidoreductase [Leptospira santarosai]EKO35402.1 NADH(P)-binding protein, PF13460 family [Leptospira santarosai str. MOR084]EKR92609.1 NADH(P)-binding protein, PF13460 family [Leptospira santarosai str. CBC379]
MAQKLALVAGATGLIGTYLLEELSASAEYRKIYALVRRSGSVTGAEEIVSDYDALNVSLFPQGITDVFCSLGTTISKAGNRENFKKVDYEYVLKLAKLVKEIGAKSFCVVSALGADPNSFVFYNRVKGEMEKDLEGIGFSFLGIFRPSLLEGEREEVRPGETMGQFFAKIANPFLLGGIRKYRSIRGRTVAKAMVRIAAKGPTGVRILESDRIATLGEN